LSVQHETIKNLVWIMIFSKGLKYYQIVLLSVSVLINTYISKLLLKMRFWNNLQVRSQAKIGEPNNLKGFGSK